MICRCGLAENVHWYVDKSYAPHLYQIAYTPEQAEHYLRSWAGKILRLGHPDLELRPLAARILSSKNLYMLSICSSDYLRPTSILID